MSSALPAERIPRTGAASTLDARLATLVAFHLGVAADVLVPSVSLADDLAVDSLELLELVLALEAEFGLTPRRWRLEHVRTYGDLRAALESEVAARVSPPIPVRTRFVTAIGRAASALERAVELTPYTVSLLVDDARRLAAGSRLDVVVPVDTPETGLAAVRRGLAGVERRGVAVDVRRAGYRR